MSEVAENTSNTKDNKKIPRVQVEVNVEASKYESKAN